MRAGLLLTRRSARLAAVLWCLTCGHAALADSPTTELRIAVGLLRSQAAELEQLDRQSRRAGLPERTVRGHAMQLAREVEQARKQLDKAPAPACAEAIRADARAAAQQLSALVSDLSSTGSAELDSVPALRERLQRDEVALPR
jgi:hypothetical protein